MAPPPSGSPADAADQRETWLGRNRYYYDEIARLARFAVPPGLRVLEIGCGLGDLLAAVQPARGKGIDPNPAYVARARQRHPGLEFEVARAEEHLEPETWDVILISDVVGHLDDVWTALRNLRRACGPRTRVFFTSYNFLWEPVLRLGELIGLKMPLPEQNWLAPDDLVNLFELAGFEVVSRSSGLLLPRRVPLLAGLCNRLLARLWPFRALALVQVLVLRPEPERAPRRLGVSVVIPCRNERGNIAGAVARTPQMGAGTELIFVDGSSSDGTREAILEQIALHPERPIRLIDQGRATGKGDAVRQGFAAARNQVLMILDADLTVRPEDLPLFYAAIAEERGELVQGSRLVYPMEQGAMRLLNVAGNKFFSLALGWILGQPIRDTLCGTKVLEAASWRRIVESRGFFGDFDPFGDFDLIFGAAKANLKLREIPVHYTARTYGETKISRFRHGLLLLRMTLFALWKFKLQG